MRGCIDNMPSSIILPPTSAFLLYVQLFWHFLLLCPISMVTQRGFLRLLLPLSERDVVRSLLTHSASSVSFNSYPFIRLHTFFCITLHGLQWLWCSRKALVISTVYYLKKQSCMCIPQNIISSSAIDILVRVSHNCSRHLSHFIKSLKCFVEFRARCFRLH